jgi:hypothetical protein
VEHDDEQETVSIVRKGDAPMSPPERERNFGMSNSTKNIDEVFVRQ